MPKIVVHAPGAPGAGSPLCSIARTLPTRTPICWASKAAFARAFAMAFAVAERCSVAQPSAESRTSALLSRTSGCAANAATSVCKPCCSIAWVGCATSAVIAALFVLACPTKYAGSMTEARCAPACVSASTTHCSDSCVSVCALLRVERCNVTCAELAGAVATPEPVTVVPSERSGRPGMGRIGIGCICGATCAKSAAASMTALSMTNTLHAWKREVFGACDAHLQPPQSLWGTVHRDEHSFDHDFGGAARRQTRRRRRRSGNVRQDGHEARRAQSATHRGRKSHRRLRRFRSRRHDALGEIRRQIQRVQRHRACIGGTRQRLAARSRAAQARSADDRRKLGTSAGAQRKRRRDRTGRGPGGDRQRRTVRAGGGGCAGSQHRHERGGDRAQRPGDCRGDLHLHERHHCGRNAMSPTQTTGDTLELTPRAIVSALDKYIVGQAAAKRAVAIAMRNRFRRERVHEDLRGEIIPKNILMIGPTGVGKTEIARRLAALAGAPFIKVEATKYTEVGYVGRDVESMVRDLVEQAVRMVTDERREEVKDLAEKMAVDRVIDLLHPETRPPAPPGQQNPFAATLGSIFGSNFGQQPQQTQPPPPPQPPPANTDAARVREQARADVERGFYDVRLVEIEVEEAPSMPIGVIGGGFDQGMGPGGGDIGEMLGGLFPKKRVKKRVTVQEARRIFEQEEAAKLIDMDAVKREALRRAGENGIIFIDEIDKVAGREGARGPDVSREGVQRDILPIVEGSTVNTKYGPVKTDHILFIAAGAFHMSKPSDLIPELQGRFPIRVELESLTAEDFRTILTQPKNALTEQYKALLATEGVTLDFRTDGISQIAQFAMEVNERSENIGARRLHTVLERLLDDVSYEAPEQAGTVVVDGEYVRRKLQDVVTNADLSSYIL